MKAQCVRHTVGHCNEEWKETVFKSLCAPYQTHQPLLFFLYILKKNLNHILPIQFRGQISLLRLSIIPPHLYILLTHTHTHTHSLRRSGHALLLSLSLVLITRIVMSKQSTRPEQPPSISHNVKRRSLFGKDHDRRTSSGDPSDLSLDSFFKTHPRGFTFGLPTASSIQKRVDRKDITVTQHQRIPKTQTSSPAVIPKQLSHATHSATAMATTTKERTDPSQILKGVVAFLDTRLF
ncbi:hypothetical protein BX666DRAFT_207252 [Dichotomocladium elegans]|nr:hypothetical protein BX666DRAFT_207252 [Dichotomocladium elegans]